MIVRAAVDADLIRPNTAHVWSGFRAHGRAISNRVVGAFVDIQVKVIVGAIKRVGTVWNESAYTIQTVVGGTSAVVTAFCVANVARARDG
jgi:hypothetical protein